MSEVRSAVYAAAEVEDGDGSFADVVQQWDLLRFLSLLHDFHEIPTVAVSLLQCGTVAFSASAGASASELLWEPWDDDKAIRWSSV